MSKTAAMFASLVLSRKKASCAGARLLLSRQYFALLHQGNLLRALVTCMVASLQAQPPAPAFPGTLADLGGHRIHVNCKGAGAPVVIIENGGGSFSIEWKLVQDQVATQTRICTYDRAGYAWSDPGPVPDGIEQIVDDLHLWTRKTNTRPPFVLVGASLGALFARAYQRRFPENVAGMVFVDGSYEETITLVKGGKPVPISHLQREELAAAYEEYVRVAPVPKAGPPNAAPLDRLTPEAQKARSWAFSKLIEEVGLLPKGLAAAESWRREFTALRMERLANPHPLGGMPLRVLERSDNGSADWHNQQVELAKLSTAGKLVEVPDSGHMIHLYQPESVARSIGEVVSAVRAASRR